MFVCVCVCFDVVVYVFVHLHVHLHLCMIAWVGASADLAATLLIKPRVMQWMYYVDLRLNSRRSRSLVALLLRA